MCSRGNDVEPPAVTWWPRGSALYTGGRAFHWRPAARRKRELRLDCRSSPLRAQTGRMVHVPKRPSLHVAQAGFETAVNNAKTPSV